MRLAFLTDEFISENPKYGGLGVYLGRMTRALHDCGHEVEVFTRTRGVHRVFDYNGVRVTTVCPTENWLARRLQPLGRRCIPNTFGRLVIALEVARAFHSRDRTAPFDVVQSSNNCFTGLFIRRRPGLTHLVRVSSIRDLLVTVDGRITRRTWLDWRLVGFLERVCMRKGDVAYAPSEFVCDYFRERHRISLSVIRPPAYLNCQPAPQPPQPLPAKYLVHFGTLRRVKGTDVLAEALPIAWREEPSLRMVWVGAEQTRGMFAGLRDSWGEHARNVQYLGALPRNELYAVVKRATASVLPSRVDNLPNTAIESLLLSVPVIGTHGASIDEIVEPGVSGELVPIEDPSALAAAMVQAWRGCVRWAGNGFRRPDILDTMTPRRAAEALLAHVPSVDDAAGGKAATVVPVEAEVTNPNIHRAA